MPSQINASNSGFGGIVSTGDSSGVLQLQTTGTTAVTIDTSQNVGIGESSPDTKVHIYGAATAGRGQLYIQGSSTVSRFTLANSSDAYALNTYGDSSTSLLTWDTNSGYSFRWTTSDTERMRIDSSGNLLIGKTDTTLSTGGLIIEKYTAAGETAGKISVTNRIGTGQYILQGINASGGIVGGVVTTSTATSFNTSSDYRLKENIVPMIGALDKVAQLKPVTYTWKADGSNAQGFIAHELAEVVPDCVTGKKDAVDEEGNPVYQGIDTSFLVATLTAAIQEQQTIINDLKARVTALEAR